MGEVVKDLAELRSKLTAMRVGLEFIPSMATEINSFSLQELEKIIKSIEPANQRITIKSDQKYPTGSTRNRPEAVVREYVEDNERWDKIFKDVKIDKVFDSLITKIRAIDLLDKTYGKRTPGIDGKFYRKPIKIPGLNKKEDREIVEEIQRQHPAFRIRSVAKGSSKLAIQRRGRPLTPVERLRQALQGTQQGRALTSLGRMEYNSMGKDPKQYIQDHNALVDTLNTKLHYELLDSLKPSKLGKYKSDTILRVNIPKAKRPLGIPTIKDRCIQKYMQVVMEPYLEPLCCVRLPISNPYGALCAPYGHISGATRMVGNSVISYGVVCE